jgi:ATP-dependent Lon protease
MCCRECSSNELSRCVQLGVEMENGLLSKTDVHIHFPAGAISKDGPSAGVTIVTVLVSLFTSRCVRSDTAMTGEVTLRGLVLPVGILLLSKISVCLYYP